MPRLLAALREHQPLLLLLSLALVVATFARTALAAVLAVLAFGFFLVALLIVLYLAASATKGAPEVFADLFAEALSVLYFASGLLLLALAGWALIRAVGPYDLVLFAPYVLLGLALEAGVLYAEHRRMKLAPRRPFAVRFYGSLCLGMVALTPIGGAYFVVALAFPQSPTVGFLALPAGYVMMSLFLAVLVSRSYAVRALAARKA